MKATLEFDLPEEYQEHRDALDGTLWRGVVVALYNEIRKMDKAGCDKFDLDALGDFLNDECSARGIEAI